MEETKKEYRLRAAPSPTGKVHIGNIRTYLYNFLLTRKYGGKNIIRIEDTDRKRIVPNGTAALIEAYEAFGIVFDEGPHVGGEFGPYVQSERLEIYAKYAQELIEKGAAYYCFCTKERLEQVHAEQTASKQKTMYDRHCRDLDPIEAQKRVDAGEEHVIRMKFPLDGFMEFKDMVYGKIRIDNKEIDDMVLLKTDGLPTYHFAVVIDDHLMKITHVFRGREYLTQTTRNSFLYKAFGWEEPLWGNVPQILNSDGKGKLSKRKGAMPALSYLRKGFLVEAVINYIMLCGWSPDPKKAHQDEIYSLDELIQLFDIDRFQKAGARYDQKKFEYINGKHLRRLTTDQLCDRVIDWAENLVLKPFITDSYEEPLEWETTLKAKVTKYLPIWKTDIEKFKLGLALEKDRIVVLSELVDSLEFLYVDEFTFSDADWNTKNHTKSELSVALNTLLPKLDAVFSAGHVEHETWEQIVRSYADELGWKHGDMFLAIRSAVTGRLHSPPLLESIEAMGWAKAKMFIEQAIVWLKV